MAKPNSTRASNYCKICLDVATLIVSLHGARLCSGFITANLAIRKTMFAAWLKALKASRRDMLRCASSSIAISGTHSIFKKNVAELIGCSNSMSEKDKPYNIYEVKSDESTFDPSLVHIEVSCEKESRRKVSHRFTAFSLVLLLFPSQPTPTFR